MNGKRLKIEVVKWAKHVGRKTAVKRLMFAGEGMSPSMAERLVKGTYESEPHADTIDDIRDEIAKDGFALAGEKAS